MYQNGEIYCQLAYAMSNDLWQHENDDEFELVLELAETDPLFEKKKV